MKNKFTKYFTPQEASQTLPLVKKIVEDLLATGQTIRKYVQEKDEVINEDTYLKSLMEALNEYHNELEELGCFFKDWNYEIGLVDFPAVINGQTVFLCWRSDEGELTYFHGIEDGYRGRKIIPKQFYRK
ncbi:MAG: DUF2203 domain-containing protein [Chlorobi bacterium]|nr:DUF2203 domain-containing protein [Chlorobiota bacterium]